MAHDLGDVARLRFEVRDAGGQLVAPDGPVTLTVTLPDGATTSPAVANPATGVYTADYLTVQAGRHTLRWLATGAHAAADTDILDVRPADRGWLISLADARATLNLTSTREDAELRDWLGAITTVIERHTGRAWVPRERTETVFGGGRAIAVGWTPIRSVTSLVPLLDGAPGYAPADLVLDTRGLLWLRAGGAFAPGQYTLTYTAGAAAAIPEHVAAAARIILKHLWDTQRGATGLPTPGDEDFPFAAPQGYAIPNRAAQLLGDPTPGIA